MEAEPNPKMPTSNTPHTMDDVQYSFEVTVDIMLQFMYHETSVVFAQSAWHLLCTVIITEYEPSYF
jgi:hypothetical protein